MRDIEPNISGGRGVIEYAFILHRYVICDDIMGAGGCTRYYG